MLTDDARFQSFVNPCEFIDSLFLVVAAIAPMILFIEVFEASLAVAVVADALAVGFVLFALIEIFGPICTAYYNPAVCIAMALIGDISWKQASRISFFQILGGFGGLLVTHLMFYEIVPGLVSIPTVQRSG